MFKKAFLFTFVFIFSQSLWADPVTIKDIKIQGNQRIESETVLSYLSAKVGQTLDQGKLDQCLKDLFATGYFIDVHVRINGQVLIVEVEENPIINRVVFEGNSKLKDDIITQEVRLRPREVLSRTRIQEAQQRILEIYRRMGRFGARVDPKIIKLPENRVDLVFEINEGPVTYVRSIQFVGNKHISSKKLEEYMLTKRARWYRFFAVDDVYDPDRFIGDQQTLRKLYNDSGYADFRILSAVAELSPDQKDFYLTFTVEEGKLYTFGKVDIVSHIPSIKAETLRSEIAFAEKETFSGRLIEKSVNAITHAAGTQGFAFVSIEPKVVKNPETQTVDITFEVKEGPRVYIEKIVLVGNDRTHDDVIRRELMLHEGDAYNAAKIKQSEMNLKDLQYFKTVTVETEQGSAPDQAQLIVKVEEQSTGELGLSIGYSTMDGPLANVKIVERNFRGKGQVVHADFTVAKKRQDFDIGIIEPYFLGRNLQASADIFSVRSTRFNAYHQLTNGFNLGLGYRLSDYWSQGWNYGLKQDKVDHISVFASPIIRQQAGNSLTSALTHTISYDRRDSRVMPTSGYILSLSNTYAGLGGSVNYLRNDANANWYYSPLEEVVLGLKGALGGVERVNKTIRVTDSVMLGADSFRGFAYGGLGPRDMSTQETDPLGGTRYWTATAEMMFPLGLPSEFGIRGAIFTDVGSLWRPGKSSSTVIDKRTMRQSVGIGIAWSSPFGPLRIDYALPVRKEKFDKTQRILLGFSTRF
ncbi:outer membrane protein assembly factor BamA [Candidatus Finniella inopinata]|uniref:Outer membrane protein assembly factor BamA n=1 Tax=Candidatus Finniella inopinata TaxID=1696036 RepID=A0A4Q7DHD9_9PROT|nr:outer membrane protein assembly factor BamA [Candidatus Finniella inopinata]RZI45750.1 outer membrane protein assembly factor BamA [Candidatus Finniella inopinata]